MWGVCGVQSERDRRDADAGVDDHQLLFTPPYESESQMIEKLWGKVKGFVAKEDHIKRTPTQLRADILTGLYGDERFGGITAADCQGYIKHALGTANAWVADSKVLSGLFAPAVSWDAITVERIDAQMRQRYWAAYPAPDCTASAVHSDSSATDDSTSDSDY